MTNKIAVLRDISYINTEEEEKERDIHNEAIRARQAFLKQLENRGKKENDRRDTSTKKKKDRKK